MQHFSKRFLSILVTFALFAAALFAYINLIRPTYDTIKNEQARLAVAQQHNAEYTSIYDKLKQVLARYEQSPDLQNKVSATLPLEENIPDSMHQITAAALANGLNVLSIDVKEGAVLSSGSASKAGGQTLVKNIGVLKNSIQLTGAYPQFRSFLQAVDTNMRIMSLDSLRIEKAGDPTRPDQFAFNVTITSYYQIR